MRYRRLAKESDPVAIIGIGCRFPGGANDTDSFHQLLLNGADAITDIPEKRWNVETFYHQRPGAPGKSYARRGAFLDKVDEFEPGCFGISPREAAFMDPQQRFLLEVAWEALEDAGIPLAKVAGSPTGVFAGVSTWDYSEIQTTDVSQRTISPFSAIGTSLSIAANRVSYCFDLRGPSMAIDTACSSALVAIDRAIDSLRSGDCAMAIAAGVNMLLSPETYIAYCAASLLSPDGRCKAFDASANGFVRGEGAGAVVLKPLSDAERDGDPILAVILASGLNQDGHTEGIAVPNPESQRALLDRVYEESGVDPADVGYFEAHGTGTAVGDPIEANTIGQFFSANLPPEKKLLLGSVKTNIGHLEAASGIASLVKMVGCVRHHAVPPNLHFDTPNPKIDFEALRLQVPTVPTLWAQDGKPAIASTNSFGFGGTNAHLVVSEYRPPRRLPRRNARRANGGAENAVPLILPITARSEEALRSLAADFGEFLSSEDAPTLADVCFTAAHRRTMHQHRLALTASDARSAATDLMAFAEGANPSHLAHGQSRPGKAKTVFVFSGQGTQWPAMGLRLMREQPVFAQVMERCEAIFRDLSAPWSLLEEIARDPSSSRLQETPIAQPAIFAIQAALVELWRSWGVEADAVLGHSIGEVAAAYAAGAYDLETAARLAYHRGRTMGLALDGGQMLAADLTEAGALERLAPFDGRIALAAINGPSSVTFAGRPDDVDRLEQQLAEVGTWCKRLKVNNAFHSPDMDAAEEPLMQALAGLTPTAGDRILVSTVTGGVLNSAVLTADYWWKNVREPVRFHQSLQTLVAHSFDLFVEIGPHPALLQSIFQSAAGEGAKITAVPSIRRGKDDTGTLLNSLGSLFTVGYPVDFGFLKSAETAMVKLPRHPWTRSRYWNEGASSHRHSHTAHPLLGLRLSTSEPAWRQAFDLNLIAYLADHKVDGKVVVPGAAFVEMAAAAAKVALSAASFELEQIKFHRALLLSNDSAPIVETRVDLADRRIEILSAASESEADWTLHFSASFGESDPTQAGEAVDLGSLETELSRSISPQDIYQQFGHTGLEFGPLFQGIREAWHGPSQAIGNVELDASLSGEAGDYTMHPALLDPCFQVLSATLPADISPGLFLPEGIARFVLYAPSTASLRSYARLTSANELVIEGDLSLYTPDGDLVARIEGFRCRRTYLPGRSDHSDLDSSLYEIAWQERELPEPDTSPDAIAGTWVIFADRHGLGDSLATALEQHGVQCVRIRAGSVFERRGPTEFVVDPAAENLGKVLRDCVEGRLHDIQGVAYLWALDETGAADIDAAELERIETTVCQPPMFLAQALDDRPIDTSTWLFLATRGARDVGGVPTAFQQSFLAGLGRVMANELRHYDVRQVDLDPTQPADDANGLLAEILAASPDEEVALRGDGRWVPRLVRAEPEEIRINMADTAETPIRLDVGRRGALDSLRWREAERERIGSDQVEIAVTHVGLNFRDTLKALGVYPAETPSDTILGDECVGTVTAVGADVRSLKVGDSVVAFGSGCLRSHAVVPASLVLPLPAHYSPAEAATLPVAFLTALHALHTLARITDKDSILIHSAAGGVGMAALQLAKRAGATVFATAGSDEKRSLLRDMGADHVMNSRTLTFADEIRRITDGRGVDIVLNSLAGRAMTKSLECLAPYGRFVELGKRDIYGGTRIDLWPFRKSISYFAVDLARVLQDGSSIDNAAMKEFAESLAEGAIDPLRYTTYDASSISEAFRTMSQGRHIGKIVIDMASSEIVAQRTPTDDIAFDPNATYLISGAFGGFGLQVARWIVGKGGRHLALLGRREPSDEAAEVVDELRAAGAEVTVTQCDVADSDQLAATIQQIRETMPPLRGVFHLAAALEDGILLNLNRDRFTKVVRPKAIGAWNLHQVTLDEDLEHFVLFSSISATIGNPGQASYAAANSFLEGLAAFRVSCGLPAKAIAWGMISDVGMAAGRDGLLRNSDKRGLQTMTAAECLGVLPAVMQRRLPTTLVARFAWDRFSRSFANARSSAGVLASMVTASADAAEVSGAELANALLNSPAAERRETLAGYLTAHVARILAASSDKLEADRPLHEQGFDSLMLVELAMVVQGDFGSKLPNVSAAVSPSVSINALAATIADRIGTTDPDASASTTGNGDAEQALPLCRPIPMRTSGDLDPLFLIHPLGVHEGVYRPLVNAMASDRPIYGISSYVETGGPLGPAPIDQRVEAFVRSIREIQPHGPYYLCGYSLGGHLALKTAAALEDEGERVGLVGLIEWELELVSVALDVKSTQTQAANFFVAIYRLLETRFGILAHLPEERLIREASEAARRVTADATDSTAAVAYEWMVDQGYLIKNISRELLEGYFGQLFVNFTLLVADSPVRRVEAPVYVWRARDGLGGTNYPWRDLVPNLRSEAVIEGDHFSLMIPPSCLALAKSIDACVAECAADARSTVPEATEVRSSLVG